ncbi:calcineurin-like phosphoesterase family protein [Leptospira ryugenii]|uniref:Calcineurin-like phosphoesterase family protein n=1 Tax=Leptospira ryugenii TaxID=1917863 RepID=A0A2P2E3X1_9LEPT|nr:metallophosphoesterase [Leptospira ryugenii]GBF51569.1 calcineurin-like phosphoesterase family protein [Leptospira ryugenii]
MKFALIGDIHGFWSEKDTEYFNQSEYSALFFTGDLGWFRWNGNLSPKFKFQNLKKRAFLIPGNWDGTNLIGILGEVFNHSFLKRWGSIGYQKRMKHLSEICRPVPVLGYSSIVLSEEADLALIVTRPHAMGGGFSFNRNISQYHLVANMEESLIKLKKIIDTTKQKNLFFLSHNGPKGLGSARTSMYGADFKKEGGDFGDEDLSFAIQYAKEIGKKVPAVLSGHMHHGIPSLQKERESLLYKEGTFYINGAKVPRIKGNQHFHTKIEWNGSSVTAIPTWLEL